MIVQSLLRDTSGEAKYQHQGGEVSTVDIAVLGLGMKRPQQQPYEEIRMPQLPHRTTQSESDQGQERGSLQGRLPRMTQQTT